MSEQQRFHVAVKTGEGVPDEKRGAIYVPSKIFQMDLRVPERGTLGRFFEEGVRYSMTVVSTSLSLIELGGLLRERHGIDVRRGVFETVTYFGATEEKGSNLINDLMSNPSTYESPRR
jgi:hypothetical protein